jgi:hypothetical protein
VSNLLETIRHHTGAGYSVMFLPMAHDGVITVCVFKGAEAHCNRSVSVTAAGELLELSIMWAINDAVIELEG